MRKTNQIRWPLALLYPISDPNSVRPHHIRHHDISKQPIANDGDVLWRSHARVRLAAKMMHDLIMATWLLDKYVRQGLISEEIITYFSVVSKNLNSGVFL